MTIFELVKAVLDELYEEGKKAHGAKLDEIIKNEIVSLSHQYRKLDVSARKPISYRDPATRFAYVFSYVPAHGDYLVQMMKKLQRALGGKIFRSPLARVSCIGGGPGSDIIALLKYLDGNSFEDELKKVRCYLLDGEQGWADTWTEMDENFNTEIALSTNFQPLDVTKPDSYKNQIKFLEADLFTVSYFLSEVANLDEEDEVSSFWVNLFTAAKRGAMFIYIDNGSECFDERIDDLIAQAGMEVLTEETNVRITPSYSEQKNVLDDYVKKFGRSPKLVGQISYRLFRKV